MLRLETAISRAMAAAFIHADAAREAVRPRRRRTDTAEVVNG
jgi:hypothetical protein